MDCEKFDPATTSTKRDHRQSTYILVLSSLSCVLGVHRRAPYFPALAVQRWQRPGSPLRLHSTMSLAIMEFVVPVYPEDLEIEQAGSRFYVKHVDDIASPDTDAAALLDGKPSA